MYIAVVVEDKGTGANPRKRHVLLSYRLRKTMYNAVVRACWVKWGTSSATRHPTGQQESRTMVFGKLST